MDTIEKIRITFHTIADALVWPVFALLLIAAATSLVLVGACVREAYERRQARRVLVSRAETELGNAAKDCNGAARLFRLEEILQKTERLAWREVLRVRLLVRLGPALGLMGTLIPMAYALQGLSEGNLPDLAGNLVTAFAATVIGLAISLLAYLIGAVREEWVREDIQNLRFSAEKLLLKEVSNEN